MALYKHVADKQELLDAMVDAAIAEIGAIDPPGEWRAAVRADVLAARSVQSRHRWLRRAMETRTRRTLAVLQHTDRVIGQFRSAGFGDALTHHAMHALGSRLWGFSQDLFETQPDAPVASPEQLAQLTALLPDLAAVATSHDPSPVVGTGRDDDFEFAFALDVLLDGLERCRAADWPPPEASPNP